MSLTCRDCSCEPNLKIPLWTPLLLLAKSLKLRSRSAFKVRSKTLQQLLDSAEQTVSGPNSSFSLKEKPGHPQGILLSKQGLIKLITPLSNQTIISADSDRSLIDL